MDILEKVKKILGKDKTNDNKVYNQFKIVDIETVRMRTEENMKLRIDAIVRSSIEEAIKTGEYETKAYFLDGSYKDLTDIKDKLIRFGFDVELIDGRFGKEIGLYISWRYKNEETKEVN